MKTAMVGEHGITVKDGAILASWELDGDHSVTELSFLTPDGVFTTSCSVSGNVISILSNRLYPNL